MTEKVFGDGSPISMGSITMASKVVFTRRSSWIVVLPGMIWPVVVSCLLSRAYFFLLKFCKCLSAAAVRFCWTFTVNSKGFHMVL